MLVAAATADVGVDNAAIDVARELADEGDQPLTQQPSQVDVFDAKNTHTHTAAPVTSTLPTMPPATGLHTAADTTPTVSSTEMVMDSQPVDEQPLPATEALEHVLRQVDAAPAPAPPLQSAPPHRDDVASERDGLAALGSLLCRLEGGLRPQVLQSRWAAGRDEWLSNLSACQSPAGLAKALEALEDALALSALAPGWARERRVWKDMLRGCSSGVTAGRGLLAFAEGFGQSPPFTAGFHTQLQSWKYELNTLLDILSDLPPAATQEQVSATPMDVTTAAAPPQATESHHETAVTPTPIAGAAIPVLATDAAEHAPTEEVEPTPMDTADGPPPAAAAGPATTPAVAPSTPARAPTPSAQPVSMEGVTAAATNTAAGVDVQALVVAPARQDQRLVRVIAGLLELERGLTDAATDDIWRTGRRDYWLASLSPQAELADVGRALVDLEDSLEWATVTREWAREQRAWRKAIGKAETPVDLAGLLRQLGRALRREAPYVQTAFAQRYVDWENELPSPPARPISHSRPEPPQKRAPKAQQQQQEEEEVEPAPMIDIGTAPVEAPPLPPKTVDDVRLFLQDLGASLLTKDDPKPWTGAAEWRESVLAAGTVEDLRMCLLVWEDALHWSYVDKMWNKQRRVWLKSTEAADTLDAVYRCIYEVGKMLLVEKINVDFQDRLAIERLELSGESVESQTVPAPATQPAATSSRPAPRSAERAPKRPRADETSDNDTDAKRHKGNSYQAPLKALEPRTLLGGHNKPAPASATSLNPPTIKRVDSGVAIMRNLAEEDAAGVLRGLIERFEGGLIQDTFESFWVQDRDQWLHDLKVASTTVALSTLMVSLETALTWASTSPEWLRGRNAWLRAVRTARAPTQLAQLMVTLAEGMKGDREPHFTRAFDSVYRYWLPEAEGLAGAGISEPVVISRKRSASLDKPLPALAAPRETRADDAEREPKRMRLQEPKQASTSTSPRAQLVAMQTMLVAVGVGLLPKAVNTQWAPLLDDWRSRVKAASTANELGMAAIDMEDCLEWAAVQDDWAKEQRAWRKAMKRVDDAPSFAKHLLHLLSFIRDDADLVTRAFKTERPQWERQLRDISTSSQAATVVPAKAARERTPEPVRAPAAPPAPKEPQMSRDELVAAVATSLLELEEGMAPAATEAFWQESRASWREMLASAQDAAAVASALGGLEQVLVWDAMEKAWEREQSSWKRKLRVQGVAASLLHIASALRLSVALQPEFRDEFEHWKQAVKRYVTLEVKLPSQPPQRVANFQTKRVNPVESMVISPVAKTPAKIPSPKARSPEEKKKVATQDIEMINTLMRGDVNKSLFSGMGFALTGFETEEVKGLRTAVEKLVRAVGGSLTDTPASAEDPSQISTQFARPIAQLGFVTCVLTDTPGGRTKKFLVGLAGNVPIVHYKWLLQCVSRGTLANPQAYLISPGTSVITKEPVAAALRLREPRVFEGVKFAISEEQLTEMYLDVIEAGGGVVVSRPREASFVLMREVQQQTGNCVSEEWIVQCLRHHRILDVTLS